MKKTLQRPSSWSNRKSPQGFSLKAIARGESDVHVFGKASQLCNPVKWLCLAHWSGNNSRGWFGKTGQILPSETLLQKFSWGCNPNICLTLTKPTEITHRILHLPAGGVIQAIGPLSHLNLPPSSPLSTGSHASPCCILSQGEATNTPRLPTDSSDPHNSDPQLPLSLLQSAWENANLCVTLQWEGSGHTMEFTVIILRDMFHIQALACVEMALVLDAMLFYSDLVMSNSIRTP